MQENEPVISIIIPTIDGNRDGMLPALLEQLKAQTFQDYEVILKTGDNRQGRAINNGAREAKGAYIVVMDDDIVLGDNTILERMLKVMRSEEKIGMAGASLAVWDRANWLQKRVMMEIPRYTSPIVREVTDSDFACHGCCIFKKDVFWMVGGEREEIIRGLDPDLRARLRNTGYRVVLVPDTWFYHLPPAKFSKFIKKFYRNGQGSSFIQLFSPELIYETDTGKGKFKERRSFAYRVCRYPLRMMDDLFHFRVIAFISNLSYLAGFITGYIKYSIKKLAGKDKSNM